MTRKAARSPRKARAATPILPAALPERSPAQHALVEAHEVRIAACGATVPPAFEDEKLESGVTVARPVLTDAALWFAQLTQATGVVNEAAQIGLFSPLWEMVSKRAASPSTAVQATLGQLQEIAPQDGIEGMLAMQLVALQRLAMDMLRRVGAAETQQDLDFYARRADRLLRAFTQQLEMLNRHRGRARSEQRVTVEHVHVHAGGQAVVGAVAPARSPRGEGDADNR